MMRLLIAPERRDFDQQRGLNRRQFWKYSYRSIEIAGDKMFWQKMEYVHLNPVRAGYVERAEDYRWSSARFLASGDWSEETGLDCDKVLTSLGTGRGEGMSASHERAEA